ncbi:MAG: hypothetical protein ACOYMN_16090 [Roseimicrobium sp.]
MSLLNSLENRFGRFAVPGLVTLLAWFQVAVWVLMQIQPAFIEALVLDRDLVLQGQLWRLVTWVFIPGSYSPIWLLFGVMLMMLFSEALDHAWGPFRVNLYVFSGILFMIAGAMLWDSPPMGLTLYSSIFMAFAAIAPNYELMLFFILPVKVKWLAMISGGLLLLNFIDTPAARLPIFLSLLNYFIAFGPSFMRGLTQKATVAERRMRFESAKRPEGTFLHKCQECGKTEHDDAHLEFRVGDDGEDYCSVCRPRK